MSPFRKQFRFAAFLFLLQFSFGQTILYVSETGSNESGDGSLGNSFATIQFALDSAGPNDTIHVSPGTYPENIIWSEVEGVQLLGEDKETTIIDGGDVGRVMTFEGLDATSFMSGFTLQNGLASEGGGLMISNSGMSFEDLIITDNTATNKGGGIYLINDVGNKDIYMNNNLFYI